MKKQVVQKKEIIIRGLVQGVGFRPFIYRLAHAYALKGTVENRTDAVYIYVYGNQDDLDSFLFQIPIQKPAASRIEFIKTQDLVEGSPLPEDFSIIKSADNTNKITEVSPDIAVCPDCLRDLKNQEHRLNYPFINCTNCGPRFSIIKDLPYDRRKTTMEPFTMCPQCQGEYTEIFDRRFHAQPVACRKCGPRYKLILPSEEITEDKEILRRMRKILSEDGIIAAKGTGGFHLFCNPKSDNALKSLRELKDREAKPFALMARDMEAARKYAEISTDEAQLLESWQRPIVLLQKNQDAELSSLLTQGLDSLGIMLPYMPLHHLLFEDFDLDIIVATSGNITDEPIIIENNRAREVMESQCQGILTYNRKIHNRTDDSLCFVTKGKMRFIRRSRGYAPQSLSLPFKAEGILAMGAELKNTFCFGRDKRAYMSQHIGDLSNFETYEFYEESIQRHKRLFRLTPRLIVHDLHPNYLSTQKAKDFNLPALGVQHHWAHIAAVMAEHGLSKKVIGFAFDGTGLGTDKAVWGSEVLVCDYIDFSREIHLEYTALPGGDKAAKESWRMALSYLHQHYDQNLWNLDIPFIQEWKLSGKKENAQTVLTMIDKEINCPRTSSAGRFFDGVSALLGICAQSRYEAEAAMLLEESAREWMRSQEKDRKKAEAYPIEIEDILKTGPIIKAMVKDLGNSISIGEMAFRFHLTIARFILEAAEILRKKYSINQVVLSGGVFYNRILLQLAEELLEEEGFEVFSPLAYPAGDGGIALGQLAIGAHR